MPLIFCRGIPIHLVQIDLKIPESGATWFIGQTLEQGFDKDLTQSRVDKIRISPWSNSKTKHTVSTNSVQIENSPIKLQTGQNGPSDRALLKKSAQISPSQPMKLLLSPESKQSLESSKSSESLESLQPTELTESLQLLETMKAEQNKAGLSPKLMQSPEILHVLESLGSTVSSESLNNSNGFPLTNKAISMNTSDPMCLRCLSNQDKLYYNFCAGRRYVRPFHTLVNQHYNQIPVLL